MLQNSYTVVLVLKSGGNYDFSDVELLVFHLRKHWNSSVPLRILCLYDKITNPYDLVGVTLLPMENHWRGWWSKMNLFSPTLDEYRPFLYIDLDTAIVGDLSGLVSKLKNVFIGLEDFYRPGKLGSGVMWLPKNNEKVKAVWKTWMINPSKAMIKFHGDQDFICAVNCADTFFQKITKEIVTFKPKSGWVKTIPMNVNVICFHGKPKIPEAAKTVEWVSTYIKESNE